jgi:regulator of cell morphogenesis and NO signaling
MRAEATKTVRELALENPAATRVFEKLGIDYCCGGSKPLTEACAAAGASVEEVLRTLETSSRPFADDTGRDWQSEPLSEMIRHIVDTHHTYTRTEIARLRPLAAKVASKHGPNHPEMLQIQETFEGLADEIEMHLMKEERILFPYILEMEQAVGRGEPVPPPMFGTVQNPVRMMFLEHDNAGNALRALRSASANYTLPADACTSYQTLYRDLQALEADLHQHIHLENNILFPRAIAMESGE